MNKNHIKVSIITNGVYYINIKEANIRILCGTPADVIKLLMKKDIVKSKMQDGFFIETGPNVILLSDMTIQNLSFSNLCEFPVLQMLYRQGMVIPNHPNNNGDKPIIMGLKEQVNSQIEYIFRGNYGLISEEELKNAGIDEQNAKMLMSIKLKFAFGHIKNKNELIKSIYLDDDEKHEIKNGVYVQRDEFNIYEISYKNQKIKVDLNLKENEYYEIPYELDFFNIKRSYFSIIHSGQGDGWNINNPSMSSVIMFQEKIYLIDAGPNIQNILLSLGIGLNDIEGIFHTHGHDDHFAGLSELLKIDRRIKYYSTKLIRTSVMKKLSSLLNIQEKRLDNCFEFIDLEFDKWNNIDGLDVKPIFSPHPIETNTFEFRAFWLGGFKTYAHLADISSFEVLDNMIIDENNSLGISKEYNEKIKQSYLKTATLKKVDVGGGMIHGNLNDFTSDDSEKIVISHTVNETFSKEQLQIASKANFGDVDELIPTRKNYLRDSIFKHIKIIFPDIIEAKIQVLMNCEIITFKPNKIIINENEKNDYVYLILSGAIKSSSSYINKTKVIFSGTLIGDISAMTENESNEKYITLSYVNALAIPKDIYTNYIGYDYLSEILMTRMTLGKVFEDFDLFSDFLSINTQNIITEAFIKIHFLKNEDIFIEDAGLYLLVSGKLEISSTLNNNSFIINNGDSFAHETIFNKSSDTYKYKALKYSEVYVIPKEVIETIPIIYLKVYSIYQKIKKQLF